MLPLAPLARSDSWLLTPEVIAKIAQCFLGDLKSRLDRKATQLLMILFWIFSASSSASRGKIRWSPVENPAIFATPSGSRVVPALPRCSRDSCADGKDRRRHQCTKRARLSLRVFSV